MLLSVAAVLLACPAFAQDGRAPEKEKPKAARNCRTKPVPDIEASRFCANVAPSIAEARIAWETRRLSELDAQVKQRLADLEKAEASVQEWVAKRDAMLKSASDDLVAIYAKMQPETAATQIAAMDDQMAAAILGKLKAARRGPFSMRWRRSGRASLRPFSRAQPARGKNPDAARFCRRCCWRSQCR